MKYISSAADLSRIYTNHSVRATAITLWSTAGLTNREIMAISGHRNESSLKSYHSMPSANQLRKCSDVLTSALGDNETIRAAEQRQNQIVGCERPPQHLSNSTKHGEHKLCLPPNVQFLHDWKRAHHFQSMKGWLLFFPLN